MKKSRPQIALTFGKRILIVLAVLVALMIGILEFAEGAKDPLRLGLQDYLSRASGGHRAEITVLEKSELFPQINFSLKGVVIRDNEDAEKPLVTVDSINVGMSFWKTFFGIADYRVFEVQNAIFATGYLFPKKLSLAFSGISDPSLDSAPPYFVFDGKYNDRPFLFTAEMQRKGKKVSHYDFASEFPVTFKLGGTEANARFRRNLTSVEFAQIALLSAGRRAFLRTEGVSFDPVDIRFIGEMDELPLAGELTQDIAGNYDLSIIPGSENPTFLANLGALVDSIRTDLGLTADDGHIKIEIKAPDVAQQGTDKNKEKALE